MSTTDLAIQLRLLLAQCAEATELTRYAADGSYDGPDDAWEANKIICKVTKGLEAILKAMGERELCRQHAREVLEELQDLRLNGRVAHTTQS